MTQEEVREYLTYEEDTGLFKYRNDGNNQFVKAGKLAGCKQVQGYMVIKIKGKHYMQHKLAWLYVNGEWPEMIDHKDRNRTNNRIDNLRLSNQMLNARNRKISSLNTSGTMGVYKRSDTGYYESRIGNGTSKSIFLGRFTTYDEAVAARLGAEAVLEYDKNHGVKIGSE